MYRVLGVSQTGFLPDKAVPHVAAAAGPGLSGADPDNFRPVDRHLRQSAHKTSDFVYERHEIG